VVVKNHIIFALISYLYFCMIHKIVCFYIDGFKQLSTVSKTLWVIIFIKLFILFFILKIFFFPNVLKKEFKTDQERSEYVIEQLTKTK
jgi:hypothetical protein